MQAYTKYYLGIDSEGESSVSSLVSDGHSVSHQVSYLLPTCIECVGGCQLNGLLRSSIQHPLHVSSCCRPNSLVR